MMFVTSKSSTISSLFIICLVTATLLSTVRPEWEPIGAIIDTPKNEAEHAVDEAKSFTENVVNGTENVINGAENVINGTEEAVKDAKNEAESVVNGTANATKSIYHGINDVVNGTEPADQKSGAPGSVVFGRGSLVAPFVSVGIGSAAFFAFV